MSRIYHQNINKRPTPDSEIVRNEKSINQDMSEIISTNRVATKIMMFTNNSVISNTKTSPSPRNFVLSSASKSKTGKFISNISLVLGHINYFHRKNLQPCTYININSSV